MIWAYWQTGPSAEPDRQDLQTRLTDLEGRVAKLTEGTQREGGA